jgi:hypothetical protein
LLCTYSKETREGFCNYKRLCIVCLSHALIQVQSVCCFTRPPESRLPTALYLEVFPKCVEAAKGHQQTLRSRVETPNCHVSRGVPVVCGSCPRTSANVEVILNLEVAAAGRIESKSLFLFFTSKFWLNNVKCEAFVKFCEASRILRSKCNLVCTWYQVFVRELRRSDESISRSSVWKPKVISRRLGRSMRC